MLHAPHKSFANATCFVDSVAKALYQLRILPSKLSHLKLSLHLNGLSYYRQLTDVQQYILMLRSRVFRFKTD